MIRYQRFTYMAVITALAASGAACGDEKPAASDSAAPAAVSTAKTQSSAATPAQLARVDFAVQGMDCGGCVLGTRAALRKVTGVHQADAAYDDASQEGTAWALYDPAKTDPDQLIAAIGKLGYTATPVAARS